jgi:hypothetical protein
MEPYKVIKQYKKTGVIVAYKYIQRVGRKYIVGTDDVDSGAFFDTKEEALRWAAELNDLRLG